jgi:nucleoside-diphosphate-sugar epimerase
MRVLITGVRSAFGRAFADALAADHDVRAIDAFDGDLRDEGFAAACVAGRDAIVHLAPLTQPYPDENASLDHNTRGTYQLAKHAAQAGASHMIVGSTLALFPDADLRRFRVDASWRPRPTTAYANASAWLAEICARETVRINGLRCSVLRFGAIDAPADAHPATRISSHQAIDAVKQALNDPPKHWRITHCASEPEAPAAAPLPIPSPAQVAPRPIHKVVVFGAGGPLGAVVTRELSDHYALRLADVKSLDEIRAITTPQSAGAPLAGNHDPKHEWRVVDVRDAAQVHAACEGMDAIINLSVIRNEIGLAFGVNMVGARNVMAAAVANDIHRVVHTGPYQLGDHAATGYDWDYEITDDVPARPGIDWLYFLSKLCGQEIVKIFARQHGLSVPALTFAEFVNPDVLRMEQLFPLAISWADSARAVRAALEVAALPSPYEYFHIGVDQPGGVFTHDKSRRLLNWQARDTLAAFYTRRAAG